jgi:uncharacterized membrane protein
VATAGFALSRAVESGDFFIALLWIIANSMPIIDTQRKNMA